MLIYSRPQPRTSLSNAGSTAPLAFVFGSPRSGTTWLAKLLDAHPGVAYLHEPINKGRGLLLHQAIGHLRKQESLPAELPAQVVDELSRLAPRFFHPPFFRKSFLAFPAAFAWTWQRLSGRPCPSLSRQAAHRIRLTVVKDGLAWFAQPLTEALAARTIVLVRHPCGVVNSMLRGQKIGAMDRPPRDSCWQSHADALIELGYSQDDVRSMADDEFETLRWLLENRKILSWADDPHYKLLIYGQLVVRTVEVMEEVFEWVGLPFTPECRNFAEHGERSFTERIRSLLSHKKQYYALTARSSRPDLAWQKELPAESIRRILKIAAPFPLARFWPDVAA